MTHGNEAVAAGAEAALVGDVGGRGASGRHDLAFGDHEDLSVAVRVGVDAGPSGERGEGGENHLPGIEKERMGENPSGALAEREYGMEMAGQKERGVLRDLIA